MACHRHNADDWSVYGNFAYLHDDEGDGPLLRQYIAGTGTAHPYAYMPQSETGYQQLATDTKAQSAVDAWLPCSAGRSCVPQNPCHAGATTCAADEAVCSDTGRALPDGTACGEGLVCSRGACVAGQACNPNVLFIGGATDNDRPALEAMETGLTERGLRLTTILEDGVYTFNGATSIEDVGAILVAPGQFLATPHMPLGGQNAIVTANARGAGLVFTEVSSYFVAEGRWTTLAPLLLLQRDGGMTTTLGFDLTAPGHPIWTGLSSHVDSQELHAVTAGSPIHGGTAIALAGLPGAPQAATPPRPPGVVVRDGGGTNGRVAHLAFTAPFFSQVAESSMLQLLANSLKWSAHCL
jgi:hypothetical protein